MKYSSIVLLAGALILNAPQTFTEEHRLSTQAITAHDSDEAHHNAFYLNYRNQLGDRTDEAYWGLGVGTRKFKDTNGEASFNAVTAEYKHPLSSQVTFRADGSKLLDSQWSPWTASTALIFQPSPRSYTELFAERDIVDTSLASDAELRVNTYGISSDYRFTREFTGVLAAFRQTFDDGNTRDGRVARLLWEISRYEWIIAELKFKQLEADFNGVGYFSPAKQREELLIVTLRDTYLSGNLAASLKLGGGRQTINDSFEQSLYLIEINARGWFTSNVGHTTRLGCQNSGDLGFGATDDDYRYCYADLSLHYAW